MAVKTQNPNHQAARGSLIKHFLFVLGARPPCSMQKLGFPVLNHFSCVQLCATRCTIVHQALLSLGFSRQECRSGLASPSPGGLPVPGIKLLSPAPPPLQADSLPLSHRGSPAAAKSLQSRPTLCDPRHGSPPGSPIPGILQASTLEWAAIAFSSA